MTSEAPQGNKAGEPSPGPKKEKAARPLKGARRGKRAQALPRGRQGTGRFHRLPSSWAMSPLHELAVAPQLQVATSKLLSAESRHLETAQVECQRAGAPEGRYPAAAAARISLRFARIPCPASKEGGRLSGLGSAWNLVYVT